MPSLTIKGVPEALYARLKQRASANRRSLNSEILVCLEEATDARSDDAAQRLARIDAVRESLALPYMTEAALQAAKREGRR